jgi:glutathione S-transferase
MKLYFSPTSPYVRKVMVVLRETGQLDDVELVDAVTAPIAPADVLRGKVPLGKIPALERADGPTIFDSRVICAFMDARAGAGLYGSGSRIWDMKTLEALADGVLDAALLLTYEARLRPEAMRWDDWSEAQWGKIARAAEALNAQWMGHLVGPLNIGQIAVACALGYVDFRHGPRDWRRGNDALASWYATFSERESMAATVPPEG